MNVLDKITVAYLGRSIEMLSYLMENEMLEVALVMSETEDGFRERCGQLGIRFKRVNSNNDVLMCLEKIEVENVIIFTCGIIIKKPLLERYNFYNIHPGDLRTNRGATPIIWSVLRGDKETKICMYKIGEGIDEGELIGEVDISIAPHEGSQDLYLKMLASISSLLIKFCKYLLTPEQKGKIIEDGIYLPKVQESDYTINLEKDDIYVMERKILSQQMYGGAIVILGNKKVRVKNLTDISNIL